MIHIPRTIGTRVNDLLGAVGLPGGFIGAQVDALAGNPLGVLRNLNDGFHEAARGHGTTRRGRIHHELRNFGHCGCVHTPKSALARLKASIGNNTKRIDLAPGAADGPFSRLFDPRRTAASLAEMALNNNPVLQAAFEKAIGGKLIPDGRADGKLTIRRTPSKPLPFPGLPLGLRSVAGHINGVQNAIAGLAGQLQGAQNGSSGTGGASSAGGASGGGNLSFEDMLFQLMMDQMKKLQADIEAKGDELKSLQNGDKSQGSEGAGGKGGGKGGGGKGGGKGAAGKGAGGDAAKAGGSEGAKSEEQVTKELEQITKKYERFLTSIDNIMSTLHKTSMSSIRKIGQ